MKKRSKLWLTVVPLYVFTLLFVLGPMIYMVVLSFQTRAEVWGVVNEFTLDNYKNIFHPVYLQTFAEPESLHDRAQTSLYLYCYTKSKPQRPHFSAGKGVLFF